MSHVWKKRLDDEAVSPVIAVILMVAITVVLAAVLYVTVQQIMDQPPEVPITASLDVRPSPNRPGNYTVSVIMVSKDVAYDEFYITVTTDVGTVVVGSPTQGLAGALDAPTTLGAPAGCNVTYVSASASPDGFTPLTPGDALWLNCGASGDPWDGAVVKYVHIDRGLMGQKEIE